LLDASRYPTRAERRTFLTAYLENRITRVDAPLDSPAPVFSELSPAARERELIALEKAVRAWSPSSHAMWALWGLVQAREDILAHVANPDFDYIGYSRCRMAAFYRELATIGA
jgi:choline kinase